MSAESTAAAVPDGFVGMNAEDVYAGDDAYQEGMLSMMAAHGVTVVRQNFRWGYAMPAPGVYDWAQIDRFVLAAARHGIRVLPLVYGETPWATSRPASAADERCAYPPRKYDDYAQWAKQIALRYGPGGVLWQANPGLAGHEVEAYELWNEPNYKTFWKCKPDAFAYVALARAASNAIRSVNPSAYIISAGSPVLSKTPNAYIKAMFKAGGRKVFNTLALHPYEPTTAEIMEVLRNAREILDDQGATNWKILVTEFGWSTTGPPRKGLKVNETKQAQLLKNAIVKMSEERKQLKLYGAQYYAWRDAPPAVGQDDFWGLHTGLLRPDTSSKPSLNALAQGAQQGS